MIKHFFNIIKAKAPLTGLLLIYISLLHGQSITFKEPIRDFVHTKSIIQHDSFYFTIGQVYDFKFGKYGVGLAKLDSLGHVLKSYILKDSTYSIYPSPHICVATTFDNAFITVVKETNSANQNKIVIFNSNLDIIDTFIPINDGQTRFFHQVLQLPDSGFAITGYLYDVTNNMYHADLIRMDKNKQVLWEKTYREPDSISLHPYQIYLAPNGGLLLAGQRLFLGNHQTSDPLLLRVDSNGNELWRKTYGGSQIDGLACAAYRDDGNIMLYYTQGTHPIQQGHSYAPVLSLVNDNNGKELQKKLYQFIGYRSNLSHHLIKDGNKFIAIGRFSQENPIIPGGGGQSYTLAIDKDFNDLWFRNYFAQISSTRYDDESILYDLSSTADGGYISGGYLLTEDTTILNVDIGFNGWIVKMDSMGCVEQSTCINRIGVEEEIAVETSGFEVYPNPSTGVINVKLATEVEGTATLYDLKGVKLQETQLVKGVGILNPHTNIATGIYVIQVVDKAGNYSSEKVIIQK